LQQFNKDLVGAITAAITKDVEAGRLDRSKKPAATRARMEVIDFIKERHAKLKKHQAGRVSVVNLGFHSNF